ncbi:MAG: M67 family metallopeptidase [Treponema sp.]|jgi:proteasome lid subunit RPN8/RPN11|nr:M67 family metallopeptidase [Treponema sp.]
MILLPPEWDDAIRREGEKAYPNECCGVLLGALCHEKISDTETRRVKVENILPIGNKREEAEQYHRFEIQPEDFMRAEKEARAQGRDVLGFYHSHPDHPARPSGFDQDHALPFYSYIIVAVEKGKAAALTSWELTTDRTQFLEEEINHGNNHSDSNGAEGLYRTEVRG